MIDIISYIKIYGPPHLKAIRALEKIAIDMPEVCILDTVIERSPRPLITDHRVMDYYDEIGEIPVNQV